VQGQGRGGRAGGAHQPLPRAGIHRFDNGPEFIAQALRDWCEASGTTTTTYIKPGSLWENGFAESLNGRFRDEFLNTALFTTAPEAQILADRWGWESNTLRPHSALQGRTPLEAAQQGPAAWPQPPTLKRPGPIKGGHVSGIRGGLAEIGAQKIVEGGAVALGEPLHAHQ